MNPSPVLGILTERTMPSETFFSFAKIVGQGWPLLVQPYMRTDLARNRMCEQVLKEEWSHLVMLDADHDHPPDIVQRLVRWCAHDPTVQIVAALAYKRGEPYDPCIFIQAGEGWYTPTEWPHGLWQVHAVGTGAICIAREVLEAIPAPWFWYDYSHASEGVYPTEDIGFCVKARAAGFKVYCDTTTVIPHLTSRWIADDTFRAYLASVPERKTITQIEEVLEEVR